MTIDDLARVIYEAVRAVRTWEGACYRSLAAKVVLALADEARAAEGTDR